MEHDQPIVRLNKHLALSLGISRREADDAIASGKVLINGTAATLGARINLTDTVTINGKPVTAHVEYQYLLLNKPAGYVCSRRAQGDTPTIYSLLPNQYQALKSVGRLDKDSSGLILLTNDGDFAHKMTHPSFKKVKIYNVRLNNPLEPLHQQMISDYGVQLEDGPSKLQLEKLDSASLRWRVTMHEGRNRQIRRTFAALGYQVTRLHRITFGVYSLDSLQSGKFIEVQQP